MGGDRFELLILAGITLVLMLVLGLLKHSARARGLDHVGKPRMTRRVIRGTGAPPAGSGEPRASERSAPPSDEL